MSLQLPEQSSEKIETPQFSGEKAELPVELTGKIIYVGQDSAPPEMVLRGKEKLGEGAVGAVFAAERQKNDDFEKFLQDELPAAAKELGIDLGEFALKRLQLGFFQVEEKEQDTTPPDLIMTEIPKLNGQSLVVRGGKLTFQQVYNNRQLAKILEATVDQIIKQEQEEGISAFRQKITSLKEIKQRQKNFDQELKLYVEDRLLVAGLFLEKIFLKYPTMPAGNDGDPKFKEKRARLLGLLTDLNQVKRLLPDCWQDFITQVTNKGAQQLNTEQDWSNVNASFTSSLQNFRKGETSNGLKKNLQQNKLELLMFGQPGKGILDPQKEEATTYWQYVTLNLKKKYGQREIDAQRDLNQVIVQAKDMFPQPSGSETTLEINYNEVVEEIWHGSGLDMVYRRIAEVGKQDDLIKKMASPGWEKLYQQLTAVFGVAFEGGKYKFSMNFLKYAKLEEFLQNFSLTTYFEKQTSDFFPTWEEEKEWKEYGFLGRLEPEIEAFKTLSTLFDLDQKICELEQIARPYCPFDGAAYAEEQEILRSKNSAGSDFFYLLEAVAQFANAVFAVEEKIINKYHLEKGKKENLLEFLKNQEELKKELEKKFNTTIIAHYWKKIFPESEFDQEILKSQFAKKIYSVWKKKKNKEEACFSAKDAQLKVGEIAGELGTSAQLDGKDEEINNFCHILPGKLISPDQPLAANVNFFEQELQVEYRQLVEKISEIDQATTEGEKRFGEIWGENNQEIWQKILLMIMNGKEVDSNDQASDTPKRDPEIEIIGKNILEILEMFFGAELILGQKGAVKKMFLGKIIQKDPEQSMAEVNYETFLNFALEIIEKHPISDCEKIQLLKCLAANCYRLKIMRGQRVSDSKVEQIDNEIGTACFMRRLISSSNQSSEALHRLNFFYDPGRVSTIQYEEDQACNKVKETVLIKKLVQRVDRAWELAAEQKRVLLAEKMCLRINADVEGQVVLSNLPALVATTREMIAGEVYASEAANFGITDSGKLPNVGVRLAFDKSYLELLCSYTEKLSSKIRESGSLVCCQNGQLCQNQEAQARVLIYLQELARKIRNIYAEKEEGRIVSNEILCLGAALYHKLLEIEQGLESRKKLGQPDCNQVFLTKQELVLPLGSTCRAGKNINSSPETDHISVAKHLFPKDDLHPIYVSMETGGTVYLSQDLPQTLTFSPLYGEMIGILNRAGYQRSDDQIGHIPVWNNGAYAALVHFLVAGNGGLYNYHDREKAFSASNYYELAAGYKRHVVAELLADQNFLETVTFSDLPDGSRLNGKTFALSRVNILNHKKYPDLLSLQKILAQVSTAEEGYTVLTKIFPDGNDKIIANQEAIKRLFEKYIPKANQLLFRKDNSRSRDVFYHDPIFVELSCKLLTLVFDNPAIKKIAAKIDFIGKLLMRDLDLDLLPFLEKNAQRSICEYLGVPADFYLVSNEESERKISETHFWDFDSARIDDFLAYFFEDEMKCFASTEQTLPEKLALAGFSLPAQKELGQNGRLLSQALKLEKAAHELEADAVLLYQKIETVVLLLRICALNNGLNGLNHYDTLAAQVKTLVVDRFQIYDEENNLHQEKFNVFMENIGKLAPEISASVETLIRSFPNWSSAQSAGRFECEITAGVVETVANMSRELSGEINKYFGCLEYYAAALAQKEFALIDDCVTRVDKAAEKAEKYLCQIRELPLIEKKEIYRKLMGKEQACREEFKDDNIRVHDYYFEEKVARKTLQSLDGELKDILEKYQTNIDSFISGSSNVDSGKILIESAFLFDRKKRELYLKRFNQLPNQEKVLLGQTLYKILTGNTGDVFYLSKMTAEVRKADAGSDWYRKCQQALTLIFDDFEDQSWGWGKYLNYCLENLQLDSNPRKWVDVAVIKYSSAKEELLNLAQSDDSSQFTGFLEDGAPDDFWILCSLDADITQKITSLPPDYISNLRQKYQTLRQELRWKTYHLPVLWQAIQISCSPLTEEQQQLVDLIHSFSVGAGAAGENENTIPNSVKLSGGGEALRLTMRLPQAEINSHLVSIPLLQMIIDRVLILDLIKQFQENNPLQIAWLKQTSGLEEFCQICYGLSLDNQDQKNQVLEKIRLMPESARQELLSVLQKTMKFSDGKEDSTKSCSERYSRLLWTNTEPNDELSPLAVVRCRLLCLCGILPVENQPDFQKYGLQKKEQNLDQQINAFCLYNPEDREVLFGLKQKYDLRSSEKLISEIKSNLFPGQKTEFGQTVAELNQPTPEIKQFYQKLLVSLHQYENLAPHIPKIIKIVEGWEKNQYELPVEMQEFLKWIMISVLGKAKIASSQEQINRIDTVEDLLGLVYQSDTATKRKNQLAQFFFPADLVPLLMALKKRTPSQVDRTLENLWRAKEHQQQMAAQLIARQVKPDLKKLFPTLSQVDQLLQTAETYLTRILSGDYPAESELIIKKLLEIKDFNKLLIAWGEMKKKAQQK